MRRKCFFFLNLIFLFHKCNLISIGNLQQPEVFVIFRKVKVSCRNLSSKSMHRLELFESKVEISHPQRQHKCMCLYPIVTVILGEYLEVLLNLCSVFFLWHFNFQSNNTSEQSSWWNIILHVLTKKIAKIS